jgi:hypothetical protein
MEAHSRYIQGLLRCGKGQCSRACFLKPTARILCCVCKGRRSLRVGFRGDGCG